MGTSFDFSWWVWTCGVEPSLWYTVLFSLAGGGPVLGCWLEWQWESLKHARCLSMKQRGRLLEMGPKIRDAGDNWCGPGKTEALPD